MTDKRTVSVNVMFVIEIPVNVSDAKLQAGLEMRLSHVTDYMKDFATMDIKSFEAATPVEIK